MTSTSLILLAGLATSALALAGPRVSSSSPLGSILEASPFEGFIDSGCSTNGIQSCKNTTAVADTCCFEANGQLASVQFWDASPPTGPTDSWTIHGLWPDYCTTGYPQSCDPSREYTDIAGLLTSHGASDTLTYMQKYWKNLGKPDSDLWEHEWGKHGTCMTTLKPSCLPQGSSSGAEAVAFFQTTVALFKELPTYQWLSAAGIVPGSTYSLSQLVAPLKAKYGATPMFDCQDGEVFQVSYYYNLKGSVLDGLWIPVDAPSKGSCTATGIKYLSKGGSSTTTTKATTTTKGTTTTPTSQPTGGSLPSKAYIEALTSSGSLIGGLLTAGTWSTQTLATGTIVGTSSSFTLSTSKGACGVSSGAFSCGSGVSATKFSAVTKGSSLVIAYNGATEFTSDGTPSSSKTYPVYTGTGRSVDYSLAIVAI